jgi:hypothetical protein
MKKTGFFKTRFCFGSCEIESGRYLDLISMSAILFP